MKGFLDSFKQGDSKKNNAANSSNPAANLLSGLGLNTNNKPKRFQGGGGQALGGTLPGIVIPVELHEEGSLGLKVERRPNSQGTAIVSMVVENSQSERAGLKRGDVLCFAGSNGQEEMMYDMFIELAKSNQRPMCFEVRRIKTGKKKDPVPDAASAGDNSSKSAEAYRRKQAMIAAAEQREKKNRQKTTGSNPAKRALKQKASSNVSDGNNNADITTATEPMSEASREAIEAAKNSEAKTAAALGYNPYETNRVTAGQARNATVAATHGTIDSNGGNHEQQQLQQVRPPQDALVADAAAAAGNNEEVFIMDPQFEHSFERLVTSNPESVVKSSLNICQKLLVNATTKSGEKFRRVRLANEKIKSAVVDVEGALELLMSTGFELSTEVDNDTQQEESVLVYPSPDVVPKPEWIPQAIKQMEHYAKS